MNSNTAVHSNKVVNRQTNERAPYGCYGVGRGKQERRFGRCDDRFGHRDGRFGRRDKRIGHRDGRICYRDGHFSRRNDRNGRRDGRIGLQRYEERTNSVGNACYVKRCLQYSAVIVLCRFPVI